MLNVQEKWNTKFSKFKVSNYIILYTAMVEPLSRNIHKFGE